MCDYNGGLFSDYENTISAKFETVQFLNNSRMLLKRYKPSITEEENYESEENLQYSDECANTFEVTIDDEYGDILSTDNATWQASETSATAEEAMDTRTRVILFELISSGIIDVIYGCISTGKEANIYHASSKDGKDYAIKIYKTAIADFQDKEKYLSRDHRFGRGCCAMNPRKMLTWAEKEARNLVRMSNANLYVPEPIALRSHALVMSYFGDVGGTSPKLKDVILPPSTACLLYKDCIMIMWTMFNICNLVHGDLSEFNLLYHEGDVVVIDVSQSVEHDHPNAAELLRKDCTNISGFFRKTGVATLTIKELFDFITDFTINETNVEQCLENLTEKASKRSIEDMTALEQIEEEDFKNIYIPKRLTEVIDCTKGDAEDLANKTNATIEDDMFNLNISDTVGEQNISGSGSSSGLEFGEEEEEEEDSWLKISAWPSEESSDAKKAVGEETL